MPERLRRLAVISLMGFAVACDLAEPSAQSKQLERVVIPRIADWSHGDDEVLRIASLSDFRAGDAVCLVNEYNPLNDIERTDVVGEVTRYHSSFGDHVPENQVALIVVLGQGAHAAVLPRKGAFTNIRWRTKCVNARKAILRRNIDPLAVAE